MFHKYFFGRVGGCISNQRVRRSLLLIFLLPEGVWSVCSEWKRWVIIALDLSAVAPSLNLINIPPLIWKSGGFFWVWIKQCQLTNQEQELPTSSTLNTKTTHLLEEEGLGGGFLALSVSNSSFLCQPTQLTMQRGMEWWPKIYSVFHPVSGKVLKIMFWKVPMADWLLPWLPSAQTNHRNLSQQP